MAALSTTSSAIRKWHESRHMALCGVLTALAECSCCLGGRDYCGMLCGPVLEWAALLPC